MKIASFGRTGASALAAIVLCASSATVVSAQEFFRIPSFAYASDAELGPINRTGFILSPDWAISDEVNLGGSGGALLKDTTGFSIGGKAGYDYDTGGVLIGFITDAFYSFADGGGRGAAGAGYRSELNFYGTVRGKLGVGLGRWLPYATAGFAYGDLEIKNAAGVKSSETLTGWTYGGGLEYVWNDDITLHGGYRRIDFGDATFANMPAGQDRLSPEMDVIDFGFVRRF